MLLTIHQNVFGILRSRIESQGTCVIDEKSIEFASLEAFHALKTIRERGWI